MAIGSMIFLAFFGMAFWVLLFVMGFVGVWSGWGLKAMIDAKMAKRGYKKDYKEE